MQLFNKVKGLRAGKAKTSVGSAFSIQNEPFSQEDTPLSAENESQTEPIQSAQGDSSPGDSTSITSERWNEFSDKYGQWPENEIGMSWTTHLKHASQLTAKLNKLHGDIVTKSEKVRKIRK